MECTQELAQRIDAALASLEDERRRIQETEKRQYEARTQRLAKLGTAFDHLTSVIRPRLEVLIQRFGDKVVATPSLTRSTQEVLLSFRSDIAQISLRFQGTTDHDIRNVILNYDLRIFPVLMKFDSHAALEMELDAIDLDAAVRWTDERIVAFVHTYIMLHQNQYYLRDQMVVDPVTGASFPRFAAAATLERNGRTYYFLSEENRCAFEQGSAPLAE